jgi:tRNA-specific 2-thiouridylase
MKAVSLFSGGLDSQLAVCLIKDQGIEVIGLNFMTPFFGGTPYLYKAARHLGIQLEVLDISNDEYMEVLKNPRYGYGKNMNPCIDCHAFMINQAGKYMENIDASFIITGEVLGQRPMSQNNSSLNAVEKLSGYRGYVLRPLSARLLPPTIAEEKGWVDRSRLLDINGRSRTRQMELAAKYGLTDYPSPAGGCLLTNEGFARRLQRLLALRPTAGADDMHILRYGRHFYLQENNLLVIGRHQEENKALADLARPTDYLLRVKTHPGPLAVLRPLGNGPEDEVIKTAAALVARYSDAKQEPQAIVKVWQPQQTEKELIVTPTSPDATPNMV